jgi:hypothetical protein
MAVYGCSTRRKNSDSVDFKRRITTGRAAYAKSGGSRSVPMNMVLTEMLRKVRINQIAPEPVFCNRNGTRIARFRPPLSEQHVMQN